MKAIRAGVTAYKETNLVPEEEFGWDTYAARLARYKLYTAYLNNTAYSSIQTFSATLKSTNKLYKFIRGIYNPVARQNKLLVSYVYGGAIDIEHLTGGAIPIVTDNGALLEAVKQVFIWSRWGEQKSLYVRWGASLGDVGLKIVDDRVRQKVRMEVLHPGKIRDVTFDEVGNVKAAVIEYERTDDPDLNLLKPARVNSMDVSRLSRTYTYTEKITKEKFETFKDGEPFAFYVNAAGEPVSSWDNEYGFVPLVIAGHQPLGLKWNANAFYESLRKVDEVNDQASLLDDQIRKIIIPLLYASGVTQKKDPKTGKTQADIDVAIDEKDKFTILYGPKDSALTPVINQIDIAGALENIRDKIAELERDMPELALQRIRDIVSNPTAPGIRTAFGDAVSRIVEARGNYDSALVRALQMAVSVGGYNKYTGFESFNLDSYDRGDEEMYIKDRPVIADSLSLSERLTFLSSINSMSPALQKIALKELDYDDKTIAEVVAGTEAEVRNAARGFAEQIFTDGDEDEVTHDGDNTEPETEAAEEEAALA